MNSLETERQTSPSAAGSRKESPQDVKVHQSRKTAAREAPQLLARCARRCCRSGGAGAGARLRLTAAQQAHPGFLKYPTAAATGSLRETAPCAARARVPGALRTALAIQMPPAGETDSLPREPRTHYEQQIVRRDQNDRQQRTRRASAAPRLRAQRNRNQREDKASQRKSKPPCSSMRASRQPGPLS